MSGKTGEKAPGWTVTRFSRGWDRFYKATRPVPYLRDGEMIVRLSVEDWDGNGTPSVELSAEVGLRDKRLRVVRIYPWFVARLTSADRVALRAKYAEAYDLAETWVGDLVRRAKA